MESLNWLDIGTGALVMYLLAMPLLMFLTEAADEEDANAPLRLALLWPIAAVEVVFRLLLGDTE